MDFVYFKKTLIDADGKPFVHPLFDGYNRLSDDGTMFLVHKENIPASFIPPAKSAMLSKTAILAKNDIAPVCMMDELATKTLLATTAWTKPDIIDVPVDKPIIQEVVVKK